MEKTEKKTILVVEDERNMYDALKEKFEKEGYNVVLAADGEQGLERAITLKPDLILLDLILPKLNGVEVLQKLREDEWGKDAKVIVLSNLTYLGEDVESLEHKVEDHMIKTEVKLEEVIDRVAKALN